MKRSQFRGGEILTQLCDRVHIQVKPLSISAENRSQTCFQIKFGEKTSITTEKTDLTSDFSAITSDFSRIILVFAPITTEKTDLTSDFSAITSDFSRIILIFVPVIDDRTPITRVKTPN